MYERVAADVEMREAEVELLVDLVRGPAWKVLVNQVLRVEQEVAFQDLQCETEPAAIYRAQGKLYILDKVWTGLEDLARKARDEEIKNRGEGNE